MNAAPPNDARRRELGMIHIAAKQLGIEGETYAAMLWSVARVHSAKDLDEAGRRAVIEHLKARGFQPKHKGRPRPSNDRSPLLGKIDALLAAAGRGREYVEKGMLRRMFGPGAPLRLEWCTPDQLRKIVAALSYDAKRRAAKATDSSA